VLGWSSGADLVRAGRLAVSDMVRAVLNVLGFSKRNSCPVPGPLRPVPIGAMVEETKPSEPSRQMCRLVARVSQGSNLISSSYKLEIRSDFKDRHGPRTGIESKCALVGRAFLIQWSEAAT
jgi:hypothetical protein